VAFRGVWPCTAPGPARLRGQAHTTPPQRPEDQGAVPHERRDEGRARGADPL